MSNGETEGDPRVLAIEDNRADIRLVEQGVQEAPDAVELQSIRNGNQALEVVRSGRLAGTTAPPELILLDLNLPGSPGFEVLRTVRDGSPFRDVPVVVVSSSENPADIDRAYQIGANAYITKPTDPDDYIQMVVSAINFWIQPTTDE